MTNVRFTEDDPIAIITIDRPKVRNAVDGTTAAELAEAFRKFEADDRFAAAVLTGAGGYFCAGADLKRVAGATADEREAVARAAADLDRAVGRGNRVALDGDGPMGPTRMLLSKPVIAAVEGYAVAGGLELAMWCDLRVAARDAVFGVFCRRWGVPLVDGGTIRLARMLGHSHALDLILTGRGVSGDEARLMGLANRLVEPGKALEEAVVLAKQLAAFPQRCLRSDRLSSYRQWDLSLNDALTEETHLGLEVIRSGETIAGAARFAAGAGRHGKF